MEEAEIKVYAFPALDSLAHNRLGKQISTPGGGALYFAASSECDVESAWRNSSAGVEEPAPIRVGWNRCLRPIDAKAASPGEAGGVRLGSSKMRRNGRVLEKAVLVAGLLACITDSRAATKYNPFTGQWEQVTPDAVPRINPTTGKWELAPPDAVLRLNPYTREYHLVPPDSIPRYNPYTRQWELAPPDARLQLNPRSNSWEYVR